MFVSRETKHGLGDDLIIVSIVVIRELFGCETWSVARYVKATQRHEEIRGCVTPTIS